MPAKLPAGVSHHSASRALIIAALSGLLAVDWWQSAEVLEFEEVEGVQQGLAVGFDMPRAAIGPAPCPRSPL
jgi:hypothetical protein